MKKLIIFSLILIAGCKEKYRPEIIRQGGYVADKNNLSVPQLAFQQGYQTVLLDDVSYRGKADNIAPSVKINSPIEGATISSDFTANVTASDNVGVSSVAFYLDGIITKTLTIVPYNFPIATANLSDGVHTLKAIAKDAKGNTGTYSISIGIKQVVVIVPPVVLPASYELVTPPVGDQGGEGSCVAFTTVYAFNIETFYRTKSISYNPQNVFSENYVFNQTKIGSDCNSGTSFQLAMDLMKVKGDCSNQTMPYVDGDCYTQPNATQNAEAANHLLSGYAKILNTDFTLMKTMLSQNHPLMISVVADNSFVNATQGFIWTVKTTGTLPHAVLVVGYDDNKNAFKIMNSWGTSWGDYGYSWIDYNLFTSVTGYYAYVIN